MQEMWGGEHHFTKQANKRSMLEAYTTAPEAIDHRQSRERI
jgi:hypothetical protein